MRYTYAIINYKYLLVQVVEPIFVEKVLEIDLFHKQLNELVFVLNKNLKHPILQ